MQDKVITHTHTPNTYLTIISYNKVTYETVVIRIRQSDNELSIGDLTSDELLKICRYLQLKPTPNAAGKTNKAERFNAFKIYFDSTPEEELQV